MASKHSFRNRLSGRLVALILALNGDLEQREGRIVRQGNRFPEVIVCAYVTEGSFDGFSWQTVETKATFIEQMKRGDVSVREMDDIGDAVLSASEIKAIASGNPLVMAKVKLDIDPRMVTSALSFAQRQLVELAKADHQPALALTDNDKALAVVQGDGSADVPWTLPLIGPLQLEVSASGPVLDIGLAAAISDDSLGQHCTVLQTRFGATLARIDLAARSGSLLPGVEATLTARQRGVNPPRARLELADGVAFSAEHVGLRWDGQRISGWYTKSDVTPL